MAYINNFRDRSTHPTIIRFLTLEKDLGCLMPHLEADLGLSNPEERLVKAELAMKISEIITTQKLTQVQAAEILGID